MLSRGERIFYIPKSYLEVVMCPLVHLLDCPTKNEEKKIQITIIINGYKNYMDNGSENKDLFENMQ